MDKKIDCSSAEHFGSLLLIETTKGHKFGAYISSLITQTGQNFQGSDDSFVFMFDSTVTTFGGESLDK